MQIKSFFTTTALSLALLSSAYATPVSIGGVMLDPDYPLDFSASSLTMHQLWTADDHLYGYGVISAMNGYSQAQFCPGCELTVVFSGYTPAGVIGNQTAYTGGIMNIYRNNGASTINQSDPMSVNAGNTGLGDLWLSLVGHSIDGRTLTSTVLSEDPVNATGQGQFDVVGGLAAAYFNTDAQVDGSDIAFATSYNQPFGANHIVGTGNIFGQSAVAVPEPGSIALVGAGLLGLMFGRNRRKPVL